MRRLGDKDCSMCLMSDCECECSTCESARQRRKVIAEGDVEAKLVAQISELLRYKAPDVRVRIIRQIMEDFNVS